MFKTGMDRDNFAFEAPKISVRQDFSSLQSHRVLASPQICSFLLLLIVSLIPATASALKGKVMHHRHRQKGEEHGGVQPVAGSHIYLFAISTAGYGSAPISLLHGSGVTVDPNGNGYVLTDANGNFSISGLYAAYCPTPGSSIYLQALGGDPGSGQDNSAIDLILAVPVTCSQAPNVASLYISETSTVTAAWALARYAEVSPVSLSASASNPQALLNAITYANNLASGYDGTVPATAYSGSLTVPSSTINSMADILAECVNNGAGSPECTQLFTYATPPGGVAPTDVFQAAIDIALNPANNAAALFGLIPTSGAPFLPTLTVAPSSWSVTYGIPATSNPQGNSLTIDHTKVPNSDEVNFPILVSIPPTAAFATTANGGAVQSSNGYDILFSSDQAGQNLLDFEIDNYNPATGTGAFWVRIPNVSHTTDTVIYVWCGIPNISNSLENALGVWSNNYLSVYHLGDGTTIGTRDSGIAGYDLLGTATPVPGAVGGAASFDSSVPTMSLYHSNVVAYPSGSNPVTLEAWEQQWGNVGFAVGYGNPAPDQMFMIDVDYGTLYADYQNIGVISGSLPASGWHQLVDVYGGGALSLADGIYVDGVSQASYVFDGTPAINPVQFKIGGLPTADGYGLSGSTDEVRISSVARSADWIATEYANQSSPNTFLTMKPAQLAPNMQGATLTMLSSSSDPAQYGSAVVLTANVTPTNSGGPVPTGQVTFYDGAINLNAVAVNSAGVATLSTSALSAATHSITAVYSGDGSYSGSTSAALSEIVSAVFNPTINCVPAVITTGENVTCAVSLIAGATSPVGFSVNGAAWASVTPDAYGNAVANAPITGGAGTYTVAFSYPGDSNVPGPDSGSATVTVTGSGQSMGTGIYCFSLTNPLPGAQPGDCFSAYSRSGASGYAANGNITAYIDSVNGTWNLLTYDALNRLTSSSSNSVMGLSQSGCWAYDSFGNMLTQGISSLPFTDPNNCVSQSGAVTLQNSSVYSTANQITSGTWLDTSKNTHSGSPTYDAAGEMISDLVNGYLYDAEGQVCALQTGPGAFTGYLYDAEGHRVAKTTLSSFTCDPVAITTVTAMYFIGPDGSTMTEMDGNGDPVRTEISAAGMYLATYKPDGNHYPITDWLGTKRVTVNPSVSVNNGVEETCSSFPFGDQQNCNTTDASPKHFTSKERDTESGLDYFGARYYGSSMGRFMSPDWSATPDPVPYANLSNPQSLNLYSYAANNPLSDYDMDGHCDTKYQDVVCTLKTFWNWLNSKGQQAQDAPIHMAVTTTVWGIGAYVKTSTYMGQHPTVAKVANGAATAGLIVGTDGLGEVAVATRALTAADMGIEGSMTALDGTIGVKDGVATVRINYMEGEISNAFGIIKALTKTAESLGATELRIEGTLANERLAGILEKRYGMTTNGATDSITIPIKK